MSGDQPDQESNLELKAVILFGILCILITACSEQSSQSAKTDEEPQRVAVIGPAIAEIMDKLDLLDCIAGLGEFGPWPEPISGLPVVGDYDSPNVEQVLLLDIDTVFNIQSQAAMAAHDRLRSLGIRVVELDTSTFEGVFHTIETLGDIFNRDAAATQLVTSIRDELAEIERQAQGLERRRVLFVVGGSPTYLAGPGSHIDRLIRLTGGENVAYDALSPYQQLSLETVLERQPEVIIDASDNRPAATRGRQTGSWGRWSFLPAVRNERVYWVHPSRLVIPGIRLPEMARLMGKFIHPEVFGEPSPAEYHEYEYRS